MRNKNPHQMNSCAKFHKNPSTNNDICRRGVSVTSKSVEWAAPTDDPTDRSTDYDPLASVSALVAASQGK